MTTISATIEPVPVDDYLEFVGPDVIRVKGHRIGLEHIVERYYEGYSPEQIADEFPDVGLPAIYTIIAYYLHNQAAVDAYIVRIDAVAEARYREWAANMPEVSRRVRAIIAQRRQEAHTR
jgi:uncharacterized protein (DUF433 family)